MTHKGVFTFSFIIDTIFECTWQIRLKISTNTALQKGGDHSPQNYFPKRLAHCNQCLIATKKKQ